MIYKLQNVIDKILRRNLINKSSYLKVQEQEEIFYCNYLKPGMTVFDVGAHVGKFTLLFMRCVGQEGQVHAFEASQSTFTKLTKAFQSESNPNFILNHKAVADKEGCLKIHVYDEKHSSWNSIANRPLSKYGINVQPSHIEEVESVTIDGYCQRHNISKIDLLKIDVEGAEYQVLLGARHMLESQRIGCCVFEFGATTFDMGNDPNKIEAYVEHMGYEIRNVVKGEPIFPGRENAAKARFSIHIVIPKR